MSQVYPQTQSETAISNRYRWSGCAKKYIQILDCARISSFVDVGAFFISSVLIVHSKILAFL